MRIAVSDFDGTLYKNGSVAEENITAISAWRDAGNVFGIATGRNVSLLVNHLDDWKIPFDFLICANGALLYDENLNLLRSISIPDDLIKHILLHPVALESLHYQLCAGDRNIIYIRSAESYFQSLDIAHERITFEESLLQTNLQQISLAYAQKDQYRKYIDVLCADFEDTLCLNPSGLFIDINHHGVNKLTGILDLLLIKGWPSEGLVVIGDGDNDIPMIRHFNGFSIDSANENVVNEAAAVYISVSDMIMDCL